MATLVLDDELHERLQYLAELRDLSPEGVLREAVDQMLERERSDVRLRPDFIAEAEESWAEYQRTGLHLTGEEVREWLRNSNGDEPPPACHT